MATFQRSCGLLCTPFCACARHRCMITGGGMLSLKQIFIFCFVGLLFLVTSEILAQPHHRGDPPPWKRFNSERSQQTTPKGMQAGMQQQVVSPSAIGYIETHMHLNGIYGIYGSGSSKQRDFDAAAQNAMVRMKQLNMTRMLIMPPPTQYQKEASTQYDYEVLKGIAQKYPDSFSFVGGGGSLNPMIQEALHVGGVSDSLKKRFEEKAHEIARSGAIGFGEMTASHLSFRAGHPYIDASPDHPLFLALADIAAQYSIPIDLHMEALEKEMSLPQGFQSPPNPSVLKANIPALERLLSHNRDAKIIWVHIGWDNTGQMSLSLLRRLLQAHPNLYMSLKYLDGGLSSGQNRPVENNQLKPAWLAFLQEFPDRFVLGADQFYGIPGKTKPFPQSDHGSVYILKGLPSDLAKKIAFENAEKLFNF